MREQRFNSGRQRHRNDCDYDNYADDDTDRQLARRKRKSFHRMKRRIGLDESDMPVLHRHQFDREDGNDSRF